MAVTIKDVARLAGVAPSSVSRALTAPDRVRPTTRERVARAAAELGYRPNRVARGLSTGRTCLIGMVLPDVANPFFPGVVKAAQARARGSDYAVLLADTDEDPDLELELVRTLTRQVDGFLLCSPRASDAELRQCAGETPIVLLNRRVGQLPSVVFDNVDGIHQAVAHLAALGHRRLAYVAGPRTSWVNRERTRGIRAAAATFGVALVEVGNVPPTFDGGAAIADQVLAATVTAVVAYNDLVALGLVNRFGSRGVGVPTDLSVVGFDDIPIAGLTTPSLSTVSQPREQLGRAAVDLLIDLLNGRQRSTGNRRTLPTHLIVRGSTGPAAHT